MFSFRVSDDAAQRMLSGIEHRLENTRPLMDRLVDEMRDFEREAFDSSGFGEWAPLAPATVAAKGSSRILYDTGALFRDLTSGPARVTDDQATISTDHEAAGFLAAGVRGAPPRDPTPTPSARHVREWGDVALDFLVGRG